MTIETHLNSVLEHFLFTRVSLSEITADQLIRTMDLTLLKENATVNELHHLKNLAQLHPVAAVCIYTYYLNQFKLESTTNLATVINFPTGNASIEDCINEINTARELGFKEIDYVFPYQIYLRENKKEALNHGSIIAEYCKQHGLTLKIILETGAFPEMQSIYQLCIELLNFHCDFLKTSTGKINQGASLPALIAILSAIQDSGKKCGVKVSGGIKTPEQARNFAYLAELIMHKKISKDWFRIGASSLLEDLVDKQSIN
ncbi:2-deoxyribose-5-phosphate aldolase [Legionella fallonii]|uniref:deoxyribose-phosphate aldolase n=1 Tax=Legionella fallonii LLAP-10 TaxID=1212491 RepID=A0A098G2U2_9GAMM|nr:deoxyribose-phosphate aldolase [Legionella fallonii]CEG56802.1 2-deoxyribose-5-phosphate aldolase [Legionella fallonii LLAP-10]